MLASLTLPNFNLHLPYDIFISPFYGRSSNFNNVFKRENKWITLSALSINRHIGSIIVMIIIAIKRMIKVIKNTKKCCNIK